MNGKQFLLLSKSIEVLSVANVGNYRKVCILENVVAYGHFLNLYNSSGKFTSYSSYSKSDFVISNTFASLVRALKNKCVLGI